MILWIGEMRDHWLERRFERAKTLICQMWENRIRGQTQIGTYFLGESTAETEILEKTEFSPSHNWYLEKEKDAGRKEMLNILSKGKGVPHRSPC